MSGHPTELAGEHFRDCRGYFLASSSQQFHLKMYIQIFSSNQLSKQIAAACGSLYPVNNQR